MFSLRTRLALLAAIVACLAFATSASAATVEATPYGGTTDTKTGGHGDLTTGVTFKYPDSSETVRRILVDLPAGGVGNPNAIPFEDRCTREQFETSTCDPKSQIGIVTISARAYIFGLLPIDLNDQSGTISEIQTDPEVPTIVGAYIQPKLLGIPSGDPIRAYAKFYPVTEGPEGDFRIRSETDPFPTEANTTLGKAKIQLTKYEQKLWGRLPSGNVFITNPTRCDTWNSWGYAEFYNSNEGANSDPFLTGTNGFFKTDVVPTEPDCSTLAPFSMHADANVAGNERGGHAVYSTELGINGLEAEPQGGAVPKTIVATLPKGLTIDVAQLGRICSNEAFAAHTCPANTQVGSVSIATPMIKAGLQGEAFLVKASPGNNLPDLGIYVHGAAGKVIFNIRGTNRFVNINQIQTTFDNIPQVGFTSFKLNIAGGNNGLLLVNRCSGSSDTPGEGGSTRFNITSYQGQPLAISSPTTWTAPSCVSYSVSVKSAGKCLKKRSMKITPSIKSRSQVRYVKFYVNGKYVKKSKHSPFKATLKLSKKLKAGKTYRYKVKVYYKPSTAYPKGRVVTKTAKFKICK